MNRRQLIAALPMLPVVGKSLILEHWQNKERLKVNLLPIGYIIPFNDGAVSFKIYADNHHWLDCSINSYERIKDFPELFSVLGYKFGRRGDLFGLPNMDQYIILE